MDVARWNRIQALFEQAVALPPEAWERHLRQAVADDDALVAEVLRLLAHDTAGEDKAARLVKAQADELLRAKAVLPPGRRFGAWEAIDHIAFGGMGAVYRARRADGAFEQTAALKVLNPALLGAAGTQRLQAERQILAGLNHPGIARLLDGGTADDGMPFLVMEYVDGLPIDRYCSERQLDTPARLRLFLRVCEAVDHAHRNLVVHRDIKPSNLLVTADGTPKLLDFGISKLLDPAEPGVTGTGERLLTPSHASPEQVTGGPITTATDVYGLGVLLYQLLAGVLPFGEAGGRAAQVAQDIVHTAPTRPSAQAMTPSLRRELDGDLDNIVLMALRKEPARRYASVQALADDVRAVLEHRPVAARADTLAYRVGKFVRRHRAGVAAAAAAGLLVSGLTGVYIHRLDVERTAAERERAAALQVTDFLAELFDNASPEVQGQVDFTVRQMVEGADARVDRELAGQPEAQLRLLHILGKVYFQLGEWQRSADTLQRAVDLALDARLPPSATKGRAWSWLADARSQLAQHDAAITAVREASRIFGQVLGHGHHETVGSLINGVTKLTVAHRFDEAELAMHALGQAIAQVTDAAERQALESQFAREQGKILVGRGQWSEAVAAFRRSLDLMVDDGLADGNRDALTSRLARAQRSAGQFGEALSTLETSLQQMRQQVGPQHRRVLLRHNLMARVHWQAGDMVAAEREARTALAGWRFEGGGEVLGAGMALDLGRALWGQGRLNEAREVLSGALARITPEADANHGGNLRVVLGGVEVDAGQRDVGIRRMVEAQRSAVRAGAGQAGSGSLQRMLPLLRAQLAAGDLAASRQLVESLNRDSLAKRPPQALFAWQLAWLEARLALAEGRPEAAKEPLARARRGFEAMSPVAPWMSALQAALEAAVAGRPLEPATRAALKTLAPTDRWRVLALSEPD